MGVWVPSETHWTAKGSMTCLLSHTLLNTPQHSTDRSGEGQSPCLYLCVCISFSLRRSQSISLSFPLSLSLSLSISPSLLLFPLSRTIPPALLSILFTYFIPLFFLLSYPPILPPVGMPSTPIQDSVTRRPTSRYRAYRNIPAVLHRIQPYFLLI